MYICIRDSRAQREIINLRKVRKRKKKRAREREEGRRGREGGDRKSQNKNERARNI